MSVTIESRILRALGRFVVATVSGLVLLWFLVVPDFGRGGCRLNANESAAIATLNNLRSGQAQFREAAAIDRDDDGRGEYGWFQELAGAAPLRGRDGAHLSTPVLSQAFGKLVDGRVVRSGYCFQLWLPALGGGWVAEGGPGEVDRNAAETEFRCGAWPASPTSGRRAFLTDAGGSVWACSNSDHRYCGKDQPMPASTAVPPTAAALASLQSAGAGDWYVVR